MTTATTTLGEPYRRALAFAIEVHGDDVRKGDPPLPYLSHLIAVSALVLEDGGSEEEAVAGLLHDCAEDHGGRPMLERVEREFGPRVAAIVEACSDSLTEDKDEKAPWRARKERYLGDLRGGGHAIALRVSNADKLHNARAILADHRRLGDDLWARFTTGRAADQLWYYGALADAFAELRPDSVLAAELADTVRRLREQVAPGAAADD